jgi:hypothetical protein
VCVCVCFVDRTLLNVDRHASCGRSVRVLPLQGGGGRPHNDHRGLLRFNCLLILSLFCWSGSLTTLESTCTFTHTHTHTHTHARTQLTEVYGLLSLSFRGVTFAAGRLEDCGQCPPTRTIRTRVPYPIFCTHCRHNLLTPMTRNAVLLRITPCSNAFLYTHAYSYTQRSGIRKC